MDTQDNNKDYDAEPVVYCARCYSLKIKYEEDIDTDCCMDCGCTDTKTSSIDEWEKQYERRYGEHYVKKNGNPKDSFVYKMPLEKLKTVFFNSPTWREDINALYPLFPKGLGKADSIILLFDKLAKESRIDDLKLIIYNHIKNKDYGREEVEKGSKNGSGKKW